MCSADPSLFSMHGTFRTCIQGAFLVGLGVIDSGGRGISSPQGRYPWKRRYGRGIGQPSVPVASRGCSIESRSKNEHKDNLHQQTGLSAGTVSHDDKFAADLGHLANTQMRVSKLGFGGSKAVYQCVWSIYKRLAVRCRDRGGQGFEEVWKR